MFLTVLLDCSLRGEDGGILHDWNFKKQEWDGFKITDKANGLIAKATSPPEFDEQGGWVTGSPGVIAIEGVKPDVFPSRNITVEADVVIDEGKRWGGILSYAQDNGNYERGWLLGYNENSFLFWVSTGGALKQVIADLPFELGRRYRVTGSFDGLNIRIYVDGIPAGEARIEGSIAYPDWAYYAMGVYKDKDENFPMKGRLFSASVFSRSLQENEIRERAGLAPTAGPIEFAARPLLRFTGKGTARIEWASDVKPLPGTWINTEGEAIKGDLLGVQQDKADLRLPDGRVYHCPLTRLSPESLVRVKEFTQQGDGDGAVMYGKDRELDKMVISAQSNGSHSVSLEGLEPASAYFYRIIQNTREGQRSSPVYEFNTSLNFSVLRVHGNEGDPAALRAKAIIERTGVNHGYCLVVGASKPELLIELARMSEFSVVAVESDNKIISSTRAILYRKGVYGTRVSVIGVDDLEDDIPITSCMVNLLVSLSRKEDDEIRRVLVPGRGRAIFLSEGGRVLSRDRFKDSGEWTHQYGDAGNTASSKDALGGATGTNDFAVQWVGRPGADFGIDRNPRMPAPIVAGGRLFHQGMNRMIALDARNGAVLWALEVPDLRRVNIPRDCGNWCADDDSLYVAVKEQAWVLSAETGQRREVLKVLPDEMSEQGHEWGYIGRIGSILLGSSVKTSTGYTSFWSKRMWFDGKGGSDGTSQVCSDSLFGYSLHAGHAKPAWSYRKGVILNSTISAMGNRVFFVETRNEKILSSSGRRLAGSDLWRDQFLVALDAGSGDLIWEQPLETEDGTVAFYLQASPDGLLITASNTQFHLYSFDPESGKPGWRKSSAWPDDHHSGHFQHPVITAGIIYLQPNGYQLKSGELTTSKVGRREGCHTYVGAGGALIYRGKSRQISMWDRQTESVTTWPRLRPSCWLNTIPASGMLLVPEGGGGCSCGGWMETSIGFLPKVHMGGER
jgi:outer membrane protein assembly factor BamB